MPPPLTLSVVVVGSWSKGHRAGSADPAFTVDVEMARDQALDNPGWPRCKPRPASAVARAKPLSPLSTGVSLPPLVAHWPRLNPSASARGRQTTAQWQPSPRTPHAVIAFLFLSPAASGAAKAGGRAPVLLTRRAHLATPSKIGEGPSQARQSQEAPAAPSRSQASPAVDRFSQTRRAIADVGGALDVLRPVPRTQAG